MGKADVFTGMSLTEKLIWLKKFGNGGGSGEKYEDRTASGNPVIFATNFAQNAKALSASFSHRQDLNGYDHPWVGGAGKNKYSGTQNISLGGSNERTMTIQLPEPIPAGNYYLGATNEGTAPNTQFGFQLRNGSTKLITVGGFDAFTVSEPITSIYVYLGQSAYDSGKTLILSDIQIESGTTATAYEPYENICPITGIDSIDVVANSVTYEFDLGRTVYGGTLNGNTGVLTVTDALIESYNGETLPSTWISDRDEYKAGATPTVGAQVVYKLATPLTYQLTAQQIALLEGENVIATDADNLNVTYQVKV